MIHAFIVASSVRLPLQLGESVRLLDACPVSNGCAGVILSGAGVKGQDAVLVGNDSRVDNIDLSKRPDLLEMEALRLSFETCLQQANICRDDIDIYEVHDAYSIMAAASLEVCGFVQPGESLRFARGGGVSLHGELPVSTFGGLKARGHPVGASGLYQICEAVRQLKGEAGLNQVRKSNALPKYVLSSAFGGAATTVITSIMTV